ncbi:MAG: FGGY family carbohydrate kinase [Acidimicrobiales bacterium]
MNILAIDQGTSSTKALVVSPDGSVLGEAEVPVRPVATADGGVEQDPEELWDSVLCSGRKALAEAGEPVGAIGFANQGETVLAWDRTTGRPLTPAVNWQDRRAAPVCDRLRELADGLEAITGLPLDPYFAAPKITWLRENLTTEGVATTSDTWLLHRLCGAFVTDAATASRWLLLDLDTAGWSPEACRAFGIDVASLPEPVSCAGVVGETDAFGVRVPVAGLAVDQQAALFAERCLEAGEVKCTYGTGAFLLATVGHRAVRSRSGLAGCVAWRLGEDVTYCLDGQVYTVGSAVSWLADVGLIAGPADLDGIGGSVSSPEGVSFVPGLAGLAAPFWEPSARGSFMGLSLATTRAHIIRAVVEGVAAGVAWLAKAVEADLGRPLERLRVDGGLTRSHLLMQIQADLLGVPVEVYSSPNATALGAAAFARLGSGTVLSVDEAIGRWCPAAVFEPSISADEALTRLEVWRKTAEATVRLSD